MTIENKIQIAQTLVENDAKATDELITVYLSDAEAVILRRLYPFGVPTDAEVPDMYAYSQCELAARYFLRRGAQGEIVHNENGVNRTYQSANDEDILREIMPYAKVLGRGLR